MIAQTSPMCFTLAGLDCVVEKLPVFFRSFTKGVDVRQGQATSGEIVADALVRFRIVFQIVDRVVRDLECCSKQPTEVGQSLGVLIVRSLDACGGFAGSLEQLGRLGLQ